MKEWLWGVALKKLVLRGTHIVVAWLIAHGIHKFGITLDPDALAVGIWGVVEVGRNRLKFAHPEKFGWLAIAAAIGIASAAVPTPALAIPAPGWNDAEVAEVQLLSHVGVPIAYDMVTGDRLIGPRTVLFHYRHKVDIGYAAFKRSDADVPINHNFLAEVYFQDLVKRYLYRPPKSWKLDEMRLGLWGGYDLTQHIWRWGVLATFDFHIN